MEKEKQEKTTKQTNVPNEKRFRVVITAADGRELGKSEPYSEKPSAELVDEMTQRLSDFFKVEATAEVITI